MAARLVSLRRRVACGGFVPGDDPVRVRGNNQPQRNIRVHRGRSAGSDDAPGKAERLADILQEAGAEVELRWRDVGHGFTEEEAGEAREWLSGRIGYD